MPDAVRGCPFPTVDSFVWPGKGPFHPPAAKESRA
jgi:hypothetical protein